MQESLQQFHMKIQKEISGPSSYIDSPEIFGICYVYERYTLKIST